jgi:hypothetical protein
MKTAEILDALAQRYSCLPSALVMLDPIELAFNYEVVVKATAK